MSLPRKRTGFTVLELLIAMSLFLMLSAVLFSALQSTAGIWRRTSSRDTAMREILKARTALTRDLANASQKVGQSATAKVGPSLGAGFDGDALTFLTGENGSTPWNVTDTGESVLTGEVTYSLWVPTNVNGRYSYTFTGAADANGYEQNCPFKWLVRRLDPAPTAIAPAVPQVPATWSTTFLSRPSKFFPGPNQQVVTAQLLGFRVLNPGPHWQIELKAVAVDDASRNLGVGNRPLGSTVYTLVHQFAVTAHN